MSVKITIDQLRAHYVRSRELLWLWEKIVTGTDGLNKAATISLTPDEMSSFLKECDRIGVTSPPALIETAFAVLIPGSHTNLRETFVRTTGFTISVTVGEKNFIELRPHTITAEEQSAEKLAQGVAAFFEGDAKATHFSSFLYHLAARTRGTIKVTANHEGLREDEEALAAYSKGFLHFFNNPNLRDPADWDENK